MSRRNHNSHCPHRYWLIGRGNNTETLAVFSLVSTAIFVLCGGCHRGPKTIPVHGHVIFKQKNLEYGSVMFQPIGGGELSRGTIQPDGNFSLRVAAGQDGAVVGKHRVRVTSVRSAGREASLREQWRTNVGKIRHSHQV